MSCVFLFVFQRQRFSPRKCEQRKSGRKIESAELQPTINIFSIVLSFAATATTCRLSTASADYDGLLLDAVGPKYYGPLCVLLFSSDFPSFAEKMLDVTSVKFSCACVSQLGCVYVWG